MTIGAPLIVRILVLVVLLQVGTVIEALPAQAIIHNNMALDVLPIPPTDTPTSGTSIVPIGLHLKKSRGHALAILERHCAEEVSPLC